MKAKRFTISLTLVLLLMSVGSFAQTRPYITPAKPGETVLVVVAAIKPEKKAEYETWMKDVMYAALYKSQNPVKKEQLKVTRWLKPVRQNADSTWTYSFIMDPIIPKTDYDIPTFLKQEYGEAKGSQYAAQYETFMARPVVIYALKQADY